MNATFGCVCVRVPVRNKQNTSKDATHMAFPYNQSPAENLIDGQLTPNAITDDALLDAIRTTPRERFVPQEFATTAYVDEEIPLGEGRVLVEPLLQARLLMALAAKPNESILVIAGATGYSAAILSRFAARVEMVEANPALAHQAQEILKDLGITNVNVVQNALVEGASGAGPYDAILIEGGIEYIPDALVKQLKEGGRIVTCEMKQVRPGATGGLARGMYYEKRDMRASGRVLFDTSVSLLPGFAKPATFSFN